MKPFDYIRAEDEAQASEAGAHGATFIAGGTNLLDLMKLQVMTPDKLVDITRLDLDRIEDTDGGLRIGALVTNSDLAADPRVRRAYPALSMALLAGASGQLRNKATTAGNLLQRTRCYYFYDTDQPCNKRNRGSGCAAIGGANRLHAILGTSEHCIASHPSDMAVAMQMLDARVEIRGRSGETDSVPLSRFYVLPGVDPSVETVLKPGDLITHVTLPAPKGGKQTYRKVRDRASYAFAMCSVAARVSVENNVITDAAIACGGIGSQPWRDPAVERQLIGQEPTRALFSTAANLLVKDARPQEGNAFKVQLARRTLIATLNELTGETVQ